MKKYVAKVTLVPNKLNDKALKGEVHKYLLGKGGFVYQEDSLNYVLNYCAYSRKSDAIRSAKKAISVERYWDGTFEILECEC